MTLRYDLDTETTGFSFGRGDRIVEIGVVEVFDNVPTGRVFHEFLDPGRQVHFAALKVHGLSNQALRGQPSFASVAERLLEFVGDHQIMAHNARFDADFVNGELSLLGLPGLSFTDSIPELSKATGAGKLDEVVSRIGLQTPKRDLHGALLDAAILSAVIAHVRGAEPFDISRIVGLGNESRVRRSVSGRPSGGAGKAPAPAPSSQSGLGARPDGRASIRAQGAELLSVIRRMMAGSENLPALIRNLESEGVRTRPNISGIPPAPQAVHGMRFRYRDIYAVTSTVGISTEAFVTGPFAFDRSHAAFMLETKERYDSDFGASSQEKNACLSKDDIGLTPVRRDVRPEAVSPPAATSPAILESIREKNVVPASLDPASYRDIVMAGTRDGWSRAGDAEILSAVNDRFGEGDGSVAALRSLPRTDAMGALRWVCRGLVPDHALCMTVARAQERGQDLPDHVVDAARRASASSCDIEP